METTNDVIRNGNSTSTQKNRGLNITNLYQLSFQEQGLDYRKRTLNPGKSQENISRKKCDFQFESGSLPGDASPFDMEDSDTEPDPRFLLSDCPETVMDEPIYPDVFGVTDEGWQVRRQPPSRRQQQQSQQTFHEIVNLDGMSDLSDSESSSDDPEPRFRLGDCLEVPELATSPVQLPFVGFTDPWDSTSLPNQEINSENQTPTKAADQSKLLIKSEIYSPEPFLDYQSVFLQVAKYNCTFSLPNIFICCSILVPKKLYYFRISVFLFEFYNSWGCLKCDRQCSKLEEK